MATTGPKPFSDRSDLPTVLEVSELLRAISHPMRLMAVYSLSQGERSVSELGRDLGIEQPTLSQQLTVLRVAGVVSTRRKSKHIFYRLADDKRDQLVQWLHGAFGARRADAGREARG